MKPNYIFAAAIALFTSTLNADVVVTKNGSSINGKVIGIDGGKLTVETDFAGTLEIDQAQVSSFTTEEPIYLTTESGSTYLGPVEGSDESLTVHSSDGSTTTEIASVTESWQPGSESPSAVRQQELIAKLDRKWAYEAAFDLTGKSGNKDSNGLATSFRATLKGPHDKLEFFGLALFDETDGEKSADQAFGGVDYSNKFASHVNWYVRTEFGYDAIKDIEQMFNISGGFGYTFSDNERRFLNLRGGVGYLYEGYDDIPVLDDQGNVIDFMPRSASSSASMDFGLAHKEFFTWGTLSNRLTYTPTINDFGNFRLVQDSSIELPTKAEGWSVRVGLSNRYDSEASVGGLEELDTTYYIRMVLKWGL